MCNGSHIFLKLINATSLKKKFIKSLSNSEHEEKTKRSTVHLDCKLLTMDRLVSSEDTLTFGSTFFLSMKISDFTFTEWKKKGERSVSNLTRRALLITLTSRRFYYYYFFFRFISLIIPGHFTNDYSILTNVYAVARHPATPINEKKFCVFV